MVWRIPIAMWNADFEARPNQVDNVFDDKWTSRLIVCRSPGTHAKLGFHMPYSSRSGWMPFTHKPRLLASIDSKSDDTDGVVK